MIEQHLLRMSVQLLNSAVPETRQFWRRRRGWPEFVVMDPRTVGEIDADIRTWNNEKRAAHGLPSWKDAAT